MPSADLPSINKESTKAKWSGVGSLYRESYKIFLLSLDEANFIFDWNSEN